MRRLPEASMPAPQSFLQDRVFRSFVPWAQPLGTGQRRAAFRKASPLGYSHKQVQGRQTCWAATEVDSSWAQRHPNPNEVSTCGASSYQLQGHIHATVTKRSSLGWPRFVCLRDLQLERACLLQDPWGHTHIHTHTNDDNSCSMENTHTETQIHTDTHTSSQVSASAPHLQLSRAKKARVTPRVGWQGLKIALRGGQKYSPDCRLHTAGTSLGRCPASARFLLLLYIPSPTVLHKTLSRPREHTYSLHGVDNCRTAPNSQHLVILQRLKKEEGNFINTVFYSLSSALSRAIKL